jgi:hypothetical protein
MRIRFVGTMFIVAVLSLIGAGPASASTTSATGHLTVSGTFSGVSGSCDLTGTASAQNTLGSLGTVQGTATTQCNFVAPLLEVQTDVEQGYAPANLSLATVTGYRTCGDHGSWAACSTGCSPAASCSEFITASPVTPGDYIVTHAFTLAGEDSAHGWDGAWTRYPRTCRLGFYPAVLSCYITQQVTVANTPLW